MPCKDCQIYLENIEAVEAAKHHSRYRFVTWCHHRPKEDCKEFKPRKDSSKCITEKSIK